MMMNIDFSKEYDEQNDAAKAMLCRNDYIEIQNLLGARNKLTTKVKKALRKKHATNPVDVNKTLGMIKGWSEELHARSLDGKANWIQIVKNSETTNLEIKVVCGNPNKPVTLNCLNFPKEEIVRYINEIYDKGGYIDSIKM